MTEIKRKQKEKYDFLRRFTEERPSFVKIIKTPSKKSDNRKGLPNK